MSRLVPFAALLLNCILLTGCDNNFVEADASSASLASDQDVRPTPIAVSGTGVHYFTTAIVHSQEPMETGMIQRSSDIIKLSGDIEGYVLYHPTSVFDFANGTLVNTGAQMFSGTIKGSAPVLLHDDTFRFDVNLETGATTGEVHFRRSKDAPHQDSWFECDLAIVGTGLTPEGDANVEYTGMCTPRGKVGRATQTAEGS